MRPRQFPGPLELLFPGERVLEALPRKPPVPARATIKKIIVSRLPGERVWSRSRPPREVPQVLAAGPATGMNLRAAVERRATHPLLGQGQVVVVLLLALPRKRAKGRGLRPRLPGRLVLLPRPWELPSVLVKPRQPRVLGKARPHHLQLQGYWSCLPAPPTGFRLQRKYCWKPGRQSGHQGVRTTPSRRPPRPGRMRPGQTECF